MLPVPHSGPENSCSFFVSPSVSIILFPICLSTAPVNFELRVKLGTRQKPSQLLISPSALASLDHQARIQERNKGLCFKSRCGFIFVPGGRPNHDHLSVSSRRHVLTLELHFHGPVPCPLSCFLPLNTQPPSLQDLILILSKRWLILVQPTVLTLTVSQCLRIRDFLCGLR